MRGIRGTQAMALSVEGLAAQLKENIVNATVRTWPDTPCSLILTGRGQRTAFSVATVHSVPRPLGQQTAAACPPRGVKHKNHVLAVSAGGPPIEGCSHGTEM